MSFNPVQQTDKIVPDYDMNMCENIKIEISSKDVKVHRDEKVGILLIVGKI